MSLVSDALKRAERDAARREAREKGLPEPLVAPGQPFRARRRRAPLVALAIPSAIAVLALVALGWFTIGRAPAPPPAAEAAAPPVPTLPTSDSAGTPPAATSASGAARAEKPPVRGASSETPPAEPPSIAVAIAQREPPPATPVTNETRLRARPAPLSMEPVASNAARVTEGKPTAPAAAIEQVFVRVAALPGGGEIRLGGIAWSSVAPLAYLNEKLVGVGEFVAGWRVERIERERVVLAGERGRIVIALR